MRPAGFADEVVDGGLVGVAGRAQVSVGGGGELGQSAALQPVMSAGEEQGVVQSGVGDLVAVAVRQPGDQPVGA
jgi:hypothetical protein